MLNYVSFVYLSDVFKLGKSWNLSGWVVFWGNIVIDFCMEIVCVLIHFLMADTNSILEQVLFIIKIKLKILVPKSL